MIQIKVGKTYGENIFGNLAHPPNTEGRRDTENCREKLRQIRPINLRLGDGLPPPILPALLMPVQHLTGLFCGFSFLETEGVGEKERERVERERQERGEVERKKQGEI